MPIYEYACNDCGHELEALQSISDEPLTDCPQCGKPAALRKRISAAAFRLKGGGWYETDFKSQNKRNLAGDGHGSESKKSEKSEKSEKGAKKDEQKGDKSGGGAKTAAAEG